MRRRSIAPTYDSRDTGPRYRVTTRVNGRLLGRHELTDPFHRYRVHVGLWDLLRGVFTVLFRVRPFFVELTLGADRDLMNDVLELDANTLIPDSTRWRERREFLADAARFDVAAEMDPDEIMNGRYEPEEDQPL